MKRVTILLGAMLLLLSGASASAVSREKNNDWLIGMLTDENVGRRVSAAQLLGERGVAEAVEPLMEMLLEDE